MQISLLLLCFYTQNSVILSMFTKKSIGILLLDFRRLLLDTYRKDTEGIAFST